MGDGTTGLGARRSGARSSGPGSALGARGPGSALGARRSGFGARSASAPAAGPASANVAALATSLAMNLRIGDLTLAANLRRVLWRGSRASETSKCGRLAMTLSSLSIDSPTLSRRRALRPDSAAATGGDLDPGERRRRHNRRSQRAAYLNHVNIALGSQAELETLLEVALSPRFYRCASRSTSVGRSHRSVDASCDGCSSRVWRVAEQSS